MALACTFGGIGSSIVGEIFGSTLGAIGRQLGYLFCYKKNVKNLEEEAGKLKDKKSRMDKSVKDAKDNVEEIFDDVKHWQEEVDEIYKAAEAILGDENHAKIKCTFSGVFLNIGQRYRLSRNAKKMGESLVKIRKDIVFDNIAYRLKLTSNFMNKDFMTFATRDETVKRITKTLGDGNIIMIGVHGMSGSGKTTLVQEITRMVLKREFFKDAVMVTVSKSPDPKTIQQQVARKLNLNLDNEASISERADLLKKRLKGEEKLLIILDDVWNKLNLEEVGIAFESDAKGCKILLTSRFERVLRYDMGVGENFPVGLLSPDEAWDWFSNIVGYDLVKDNEFQRLGKDIVKECECLPIAIKIIAHEMKGRDLPSWSDALEQLRRSNLTDIHDMHEKVYSPIILSYNSLQKDSQSLFLLCGVLQQNSSIKIEDLVRYAFGWDMFESSYPTLQGARDRVHRMINELKDRWMLLDGNSHNTVRLHDLVHDVGISVAKEKFMYCFRNGAEVEGHLRRNTLKNPVAILLPNDYVNVHQLCQRLEYKELGIIRMSQNDESSQIPDHFFEYTRDLRVLHLWYSHKLPSSLCSLRNLSTLCLRYAGQKLIAQIGELQKLEILDLSWSKIKELPREIERLTSLRLLDLRWCTQLEVIQPSVIQHLASLEELYVENSFKNWDHVEVVHNIAERRNASLLELQDLAKLTTLHLDIVDIKMLPKDLSFRGNLERYKISVGHDRSTFDIIDDCSRYLGICKKLFESDQLQERLQTFLKNPQVLYLNGIDQGVDEILYELSEKGYPELKQLRLENDDKIRCLINSSNMREIHPPAPNVFCMLELLYLNELRNLKKICDGKVTKESFHKLRDIEVRNCTRLKNLLPSSPKNLEKLTILQCEWMEEIVENQDDDEEVIEIFPQLLSMSLMQVPKLSQFCSKLKKNHMSRKGDQEEPYPEDSVKPFFSHKFVFPALNKFQLQQCHCKKIWDDLPLLPNSFRNLTILIVEDCHFIKNLFASAVAASFEQLESLRIEDCEEMEEIVSGADEGIAKIAFPRLNHLILRGLPKLTAFSISISIDFPALTILSISRCCDLETFISKSQENSMPSLFNQKFLSFPKLEELKVTGCHFEKIGDYLCCPCLIKLKVVDCYFLKNLFSSAMAAVSLKQLRIFEIRNCEMMEEIIIKDETTDDILLSNLKDLNLEDLPNLTKFSSQNFIEFQICTSLRIKNCLKFKTFVSKSSQGKPSSARPISLFNEKVAFPSLGSVELDGVDRLEMIWQYELNSTADSFCKLEYLEIQNCKNLAKIFLPCSLHKLRRLKIRNCEMVEEILEIQMSNPDHHETLIFPNLKYVEVSACPTLKSIFPASVVKGLFRLRIYGCGKLEEIFGKDEGLEPTEFVFPQLLTMELQKLPNLVSFCGGRHPLRFPLLRRLVMQDSLKMKVLSELLSFEGTYGSNEFLSHPKLKELKLISCPIERICDYQVFGCLTELDIVHCHFLKNLFSSTTALVCCKQLFWINIRECRMMEEIIVEDETTDDISFSKLEFLNLEELPNLTKFSSQNFVGFEMCIFLGIKNCPIFKTLVSNLSQGQPSNAMPISLFNEKVAFPSLEIVELYGMDSLEMIWQYGLISTADSFCKLEYIEIRNCKNLTKILLPCNLYNLRSLKIRYCEILEGIFEIQMPNPDHQGARTFPNVEIDIEISACPTLKSIFPASVVKGLYALAEIKIYDCGKLEEIVGK